MKKWYVLFAIVFGCFFCVQGAQAESTSRLGVGVNYWSMLDDIEWDDIDEDGFSWLVTYQLKFADYLKMEADLEMYQSGFLGSDSAVYAPQAYLVLGSTIYAAAGIGVFYADSEFANDPFYALRAGLDLEIIPKIFLDLNVNYRFLDRADLSNSDRDIGSDTMTLGTAIRYEF